MQKQVKRRIAAGLCAATIAAAAILVYAPPAPQAAPRTADPYRHFDLFGEVFESVRQNYVEPTEDSDLIKAAINGMLTSLDPHSAYLDPDDYKNMKVHTRGEFGGLGIEVTMEKGLVKVIAPIDGTPAARAGVQSGDLITHIDEKRVLGLTLPQAVALMRGAPKTSILLTIKRAKRDEPLNITIVRDIIKIRAVRKSLEGDIGYLRLTTFNETAAENLEKAARDLQKEAEQPLVGYVLDLRNNPGGLLDQAVKVTDLFLTSGEIVSTRRRDGRVRERYNARKDDITSGKPLIVLINGGAASASEIVAGALQDQRRALIVGTLSFGKGSVQTIKPLGGDKGALRLTTARYYTPSGRSIQAVGVEPDIIVEQVLSEKDKALLRITGETDLLHHLDAGKDKKQTPRSGSASYIPTDKTDDTQLNHALGLLRRMDANGRSPAAAIR